MNPVLIKRELTRVLTGLFGPNLKVMIDRYYDLNQADELMDLADQMLSGYMGKENAQKILKRIVGGRNGSRKKQ